MKPRIKLNLRSGKYECKWCKGSWVGFGDTPVKAFNNFKQINGFPLEELYHLAA